MMDTWLLLCIYKKKKLTGNSDKLPPSHSNQLLLEQAPAPALDQIQLLIHLIRAIKHHVQRNRHAVLIRRPLVQIAQPQPRRLEQALGLAARRHKRHVAVERGTFGGNGLDDVDDGAAGADADEAVRGQEVLVDGLEGGGAFGGVY